MHPVRERGNSSFLDAEHAAFIANVAGSQQFSPHRNLETVPERGSYQHLVNTLQVPLCVRIVLGKNLSFSIPLETSLSLILFSIHDDFARFVGTDVVAISRGKAQLLLGTHLLMIATVLPNVIGPS